ncbi:MAG: DUF3667 domain-containing protein [Saprospiraceae bacterium]|nr:DUF3667 domain-containing protein [Saprospiraceae bacterium]
MSRSEFDTDRPATLKCYNCEKVVSLQDKYCPHCGQANHPTRLTVFILMKDFVNNFFDLDSKFFKTLFHIYSPSFLTKEYVAGKRRKYANPIRLFVVSIVALFAVLMFYLDDVVHFEQMDDPQEELYSDNTKSELFDKFNEYVDTTFSTQIENKVVDSIKIHVFKNIKPSDSTYVRFPNMKFNFGGESKSYNFLSKDVLEMEPDSVLKKYEITKLEEKIFVKQFLKSYVSGGRTLQYLISNMFWVVILAIIISAFLLKLLYVRHEIYYIEHIILLCNAHTLLFVILILSLSTAIFHEVGKNITLSLISFYWLYFIFIFKRYYQQGFFKTLIKFFIFILTYSFILIMCTIFVVFVSFLLF